MHNLKMNGNENKLLRIVIAFVILLLYATTASAYIYTYTNQCGSIIENTGYYTNIDLEYNTIYTFTNNDLTTGDFGLLDIYISSDNSSWNETNYQTLYVPPDAVIKMSASLVIPAKTYYKYIANTGTANTDKYCNSIYIFPFGSIKPKYYTMGFDLQTTYDPDAAISVVEWNQDINTALLAIIAFCLIIITFYILSKIVLR